MSFALRRSNNLQHLTGLILAYQPLMWDGEDV